MRNFILAIFFCCGVQLWAEHQNNWFLPGDAFFSTSLTVEEMSDMEEDSSGAITLGYERLDNRWIPGGHLGYSDLKLGGVDADFKSNFLRAYQEMRGLEVTSFFKLGAGDKEELFEGNPVVALVYNKGKVIFPLGLKFNENWKEEGEDEYCGFLDDGWSILQDWKRGEKVPPLKLSKDLHPKEHHYLTRGVVAKLIEKPLLLEASDTEIVFVGLLKQRTSGLERECPNLKHLAKFANWKDESAKPAYAYYIRVTSEKVTKVSYEYGHRSEWILDEKGEWAKKEEK